MSEQDLGKKHRAETCPRQPKGFCITGTLLGDTGYPKCHARSFAGALHSTVGHQRQQREKAKGFSVETDAGS